MWALVVVVAVVLGVQRYKAGIAEQQPDFEGFFLPAARAVVAGGSPYQVEGYFYSPLVALILVPVAHSSIATEYWTVLRVIAGVGACVLAGMACAPRGNWTRAGIVTAGSLVTLLWSWPTTLDVWAGQVQLLVLLTLCAAALAEIRGHRFLAGLALGAGAMIKTWPGLFTLWLVRKGAMRRGRQWLGVATAAAIAIGLTLLTAGIPGLRDLVVGSLSGGDQPLLAANSVWGLPRILFSATPVATPLIESSPLQGLLTVVLLLWVVTLGVIALVRPGPSFVALFNIAFVVILLLPVSHYFYVLYALPVLWWWGAHLMSSPRSWMAWVAVGTLLVWWVVVFRVPPAGDGFMTTTWPSLLRIFGTSAAAATVSVVAAASLHRSSARVAAAPTPATTES